jgi:hypothetical protein
MNNISNFYFACAYIAQGSPFEKVQSTSCVRQSKSDGIVFRYVSMLSILLREPTRSPKTYEFTGALSAVALGTAKCTPEGAVHGLY